MSELRLKQVAPSSAWLVISSSLAREIERVLVGMVVHLY